MAHGGVLGTHDVVRLQMELAAALEHADRAEVQLRTATEEALRLSNRMELLQEDFADAKRELAKSREETVTMTSLASTHGTRAVELDREVICLREKLHQLELDASSMAAERDRFQVELDAAQATMNNMVTTRNQLINQLEDAAKHLARSSAAAAAAEDRHRAEMQKLQLRLAASEAEFRAVQYGKGNMQEDLQRARGELLVMQSQLKDESRSREEQISECRRLHRELDMATEATAQAQRMQRAAAAKADELEEEVQRLRAAYSTMEVDFQIATERLDRLQEEARVTAERNTEMAGQVHSLTANLRHLEVENARLTDGHAMLRVELEARAAEGRSARGEAAELAADRARLLAEMQQQKPVSADDDVSHLRDALAASRVEVARLQKELEANDVVLADAEFALVALASEKEILQRALNAVSRSDASMMGGRAAPENGTAVRVSPQRSQALDGSRVDQERMMSYLQSLPDADVAAGPSESGHDHSPATTPAVTSPRPESNSSSTMAAATASLTTTVRVMAPPAPVSTTPRYPAPHTFSTSESASTLPAYHPGRRNDSWEMISATSTDNSRKEGSTGEVVTVAGVPSATSLVVESISFAAASGLVPHSMAPSMSNDVHSEALVAAPTIRSVPSASVCTADMEPAAHGTNCAMSSLIRGESAASPTGLPDSGDISLAGMAHDYNADSALARGTSRRPTTCTSLGAVAASLGVGGTATTATGTLASRLSLLPPRSPHGKATFERLEVDSVPLAHRDAGHQGQGQQSCEAPHPNGAPASSYTALSKVAQQPSRPQIITHPVPPEFTITPHPEVYRGAPQPHFTSLAPYPSCPTSSAAIQAPASATSPAGGYSAATLATQSPSGAAPAGWTSRGPDAAACPLAWHAVSVDTVSALQSSPYRSPTRVSLIAQRPTMAPGAAQGAADLETAASRQGSLGSINAASSSSPMISPRVMIEARMLSRAVRASADALSNPVRPSGVVSGGAHAGADPGTAGPQQATSSDSATPRTLPVNTFMSSVGQQPNRPQQQPSYHMANLAVFTPPSAASQNQEAIADAPLSPVYQTSRAVAVTRPSDLAAFPSPFASGSAAAAVTSPRSSGLVGTVAPTSLPPAQSPPSPKQQQQLPMVTPVPSPIISTMSLPLPRVSGSVGGAPPPPLAPERYRESQGSQTPSGSPRQSARPSFTATCPRLSTGMPEVGTLGCEAISEPTPGDETLLPDGKWQMHQTAHVSARVGSPSGVAYPMLLPPAPSEEDVALVKRLAAMDDALRVIGAI